jgi:hypothetical protein
MSNSNSGGGIGLGGVLLVVFIVLKLCEVIAWSWWWVLCPLWIPIAVWLVLVVIAGIFSSWK